MNENKITELGVNQLDNIAGGAGKPKQDFGKATINCPSCGAENDLPVLIRPGMKFHCTECGAELEI